MKCKSGINGWRNILQKTYASLDEFRHYSDIYGLADRLGYESADDAWDANPVIEGSTVPSDFRKVRS